MGSWGGEVRPTQLERQRICQLPGDWTVLGDGVLTDVRRGLAIVPEGGTGMWGKVPPLEGTDHLGTAVPCEGHGWEREQEPVRLPQPFFVPCAAVPVMEFLHSHSKSV